jgi:hypothetical protein
MGSQVWVVATLLVSIVLIVLTIVKLKFHPFLALLLASFFVGAMMGMSPLDMVNAIESGIGGTLGFLAAVIGLGTILGKMMEVSGAAERIGIALQLPLAVSRRDYGAGGPDLRDHAVRGSGRGAADPAGVFHRQKDQHVAAEAGHSAVYRADGGALRGAAASGRAVCDQ